MSGAWVLLKSYDSEAEARVVESFLSSNGISVQLLGTFSRYTVMVPGKGQKSGMQLLVPQSDLDRAKTLLHEQERSSHLTLVDNSSAPVPPRVDWRIDKIVVVLLLLLVGVIFLVQYIG